MAKNIIQPANRIKNIKPYFFVDRNKRISQLLSKDKDVIRLDIGAPDLPPSKEIIDVLTNEVNKHNTHSYTPLGGGENFIKAITNYYGMRFGVEIDPEHECLGLIGSKEGLFNLGQSILNPHDIALVPNPGYPVYKATSFIAGADIYDIPLLEKNNYLPIFESIPKDILYRSKILWLNYPNNPTGATANIEFFESVIDFFKKYNVVIINDAAYSDVYYDNQQVPSILEVKGAKEFCVEINSLSKSFNMAGWRLGMAVGCKQVINALKSYKSQVDSSTFMPILTAGIEALKYNKEWVHERNSIYLKRLEILYNSLCKMGFTLSKPTAGMYLWVKFPELFQDSLSFSNKLLNDINISTTPGIIFGNQGEGYLRFSLGTSTDRINEAINRLSNYINL